MKIAFVHCRITPGGALAVLQDLIDEQKCDQAKVFTLFSDRQTLQTSKHSLNVITALPRRMNQLFLFCSTHKIPLLSRLLDYRNLMFFYPTLMWNLSRKIKKYWPENIVISSFAVAKNITPVSWVPMSLYLHSPIQYIWSHNDEYKAKLRWFKGKIFRRVTHNLRKRDLKYTKFDTIYANSEYTAELAKKLYGMNKVTISYPHIDPAFSTADIVEQPLPYYIYMGRLVNFVRESDVIIRLFNELGLPLIVMGSWPDEVYLKSIAKENIVFVGWIANPHEKIKILSQSKWLINLTKESFWMGTAEALLLGVPVFWFDGWATPSLVNKDAGILVKNKSLAHLLNEFPHFAEKQWNRKQIAIHARRKLNWAK